MTEKRSSARWIPWAVLAVGVGLTLAVRRGSVERARAEARASFVELAGKLGASQILAKPFTGQEILAAITQVLGS